MTELDKTMPAALADLMRPRRLSRVHRTVARSRAEGALFDAAAWSVFAFVLVATLLIVVSATEAPLLASFGIDDTWLVAGTLLAGLFVGGALWWRWFKWNLHAIGFEQRAPGSPAPPREDR